MGSHPPSARIHHVAHSLTLVRQSPGERLFLDRKTDQEYLLLTRLAQPHDHLDALLQRRKELRGGFLPELVDFARESQGYCSDTAVVHILFRHPAKSLAEEQLHRASLQEGFEEGELLMVGYCALMALQEFAKMGEAYELPVTEETLLIEIDGKIVLSDAARFKEQPSRRSLRRICSEQGRLASRIAAMQLGAVLHRLVSEGPPGQRYSQDLARFVEALRAGQFLSYEQALAHLQLIKEAGRSKRSSKKQGSLEDTPSCMPLHDSQDTPIGELMHLMDQRQPLREIGNRAKEEKRGKKKESRHHVYKSEFQARKAEAFAEENAEPLNQESTSIRLDEISSIQERPTFRETEEDEPQAPLDTAHILPEEFARPEPQVSVGRIELFSSSRPERLKQLVLNQKGIIYEQSGDELSSLASHRTQRLRNFSFYND